MTMKQQGFTLVELIVTVALAAMVMTLGVPSLQTLIRNNQLVGQANTFVTAINLARVEAIKRASRVTLCKKSAISLLCDTSPTASYDDGFLVFADSNGDGNYNPGQGEQLIRAFDAIPEGMIATGNNSVKKFISYVEDGTAQTRNGGLLTPSTIVLSKDSCARNIHINAIGRARVEVSC